MMKRGLIIAFVPVLAAGCSQMEDMGIIKAQQKAMPKGERELVLLADEALMPKAAPETGVVSLPKAEQVTQWHQAGYNATHQQPHVAGAADVNPSWEAKLGIKSNLKQRLLCEPIVVKDKILLYTPDSYVSAYDTKTGTYAWSIQIMPDQPQDAMLGGGVAYHDGKVFVSTPFSELYAIEMESGKPLWRAKVDSPLRAAPTVADGRVYVISLTNQLTAYDEKTGSLLWTHAGAVENSGLLGGSKPAVSNGVVIAPYSSGEVHALQADNGYPLWSQDLSSANRTDSFGGMPHVRAKPVIKDGVVYVVSQSGRAGAYDIRTGAEIWTHEFGGAETPLIAGNSLFMMTNDGQLVCLERTSGKVRWTKELDKWQEPAKNKGRIVWTGPVLLGSKLYLASSPGTLLALDPNTGEEVHEQKVPGHVVVPPIAVDGTVYVVTESGYLCAFK